MADDAPSATAGVPGKRARVLVTRPREDAQAVADALAARGLEVMTEPLLAIEPVADATLDTEGLQGILVTSANGIRALAATWVERALPVWTVGDASARTARELGYARVESAGGDVETLAALVRERCDPQAGDLLHAAASVTAGDLGGRLAEAGFTVRRVVLYQAKPASHLSEDLCAALRNQAVDTALFFSPRTAATFATLVGAAGLGDTTARITAYALSPAVADKLAALPWAALRLAAAPTQAALLAALDDDLAAGPDAADPRIRMSQTDEPKTDAAETPVPPPEEPAAQPEVETPPEAPAAKPGTWMPVAVAVLLVAVIGVGAAVWSEWRHMSDGGTEPPRVETAATAQELEALRTELAAARERLSQLEQRPAATPGADLTPLENRLTQAEGGLRALQAQPQVPAKLTEEVAALNQQVAELKRTAADAAAVLRLADRVEKVESLVRDMQARRTSAAALLLAVGQLREAVANAMPFDAELRAVKALAGSDPELAPAIEALKPRAVTGIPTLPVLAARLSAQAPAIVRAQVLPEQQNWWRQTLDRMGTLVTIEREDGAAAGTSPAAILARAQAALAKADLTGAVAEMEGLEGGPAEQAAPWLADAKARLAATKAASELTAHVVATVGAGQ